MMRERCVQRSISAIVLVTAALSLPGFTTAACAQGDKPQAELAARGERKARDIKYGGWQKFCFKTPGTAVVCRTTLSGAWETGQSAIRVDLIEREGETTA